MQALSSHAVLTSAQMSEADRLTIAGGTPGFTLMQRAGEAATAEILKRFAPKPVVVLAGPGNNGGDGFIIAEALRRAGWKVRVGLLGERAALKGDAAQAAVAYQGELHPLHPFLLNDRPLIVDALFGTGLSRPVEGVAAEVLDKAARQELPCVAVDIPSGVDGDTGAILGVAAPALLTVTFHRKKRGHILYPGRGFCGEIVVADIGIAAAAMEGVICENAPTLWMKHFPWPQENGHKFARGHVVVQGGGKAHTGAARLAARAALRMAGLVTVACNEESLPLYAAESAALMTRIIRDEAAFIELLKDERIRAFLIGPGAGIGEETRNRAITALALKKAVVLDADAITVFARKPKLLFEAVRAAPTILTPHEGEFARLFDSLVDMDADKVSRAQQAAGLCGAIVVLKGADTVIAAPDGRAVVNTAATPWLSTAGSGDVLAGMCAGLLGSGMPAFDAACAAVWLHGAAAVRFGAGLIAEDLPDMIPAVLNTLYESRIHAHQFLRK